MLKASERDRFRDNNSIKACEAEAIRFLKTVLNARIKYSNIFKFLRKRDFQPELPIQQMY